MCTSLPQTARPDIYAASTGEREQQVRATLEIVEKRKAVVVALGNFQSQ
jgi:hypothetical protein